MGVTLRPDLTRDQIQAWLRRATELRDALVAPPSEDETQYWPADAEVGDVADVAVGFGSSFFFLNGAPRIDPLQRPAGFEVPPAPLPGVPIAADVLFYIMALSEARVADFLAGLWNTRPELVGIVVERGHQRIDGTEVFGFKDGIRNVPRDQRPEVVFVDLDTLLEEPRAAEGGSYMVYMKIAQHIDPFNQLPADQQEKVVGRRRSGVRVDQEEGSDPQAETTMPEAEPPSVRSHVRKVGPRGPHDDVLIFRRGLPFVEGREGQFITGLHFVSFQASLDQFDVIFNDWMMNPSFPQVTFGVEAVGVDALLDPAAGLTTFLSSGVFFCPPERGEFIGATLFEEARPEEAPASGRVAIRKRVVDPSNPQARFERGGFRFQILDKDTGQLEVDEVLVTDSKGHALSSELPAGKTYVLRELDPVPQNIQKAPDQEFALESARKVMRVQNTVTAPGGYGTR